MLNNAHLYYKENSGQRNDALLLDIALKRRLKALASQPSSNRTLGRSPLVQNQPDYSSMSSSAKMNTSPHPNLDTGSSSMNSFQQPNQSLSLVQRLMMELYQAVRDYQVNGRVLSNLFMRLPSKAEMPSYYEFIKKPIELQVMAKQLIQGKYTELDEFLNELFLVFDNACKFNEPNSQIYLVCFLVCIFIRINVCIVVLFCYLKHCNLFHHTSLLV